MKSPIALFVYNRVDCTQKTIDALRRNAYATESDLMIFSDGPKGEGDRPEVLRVREYVQTISGFKSIKVLEGVGNRGLANSIIDGVTVVLEGHDTVIVLEDDMVTSPYFLKYMNDALELYRMEDRVVSIHGYVYPLKQTLPASFFLRGADCWGWATWRRGWELFEPNGMRLLAELERRKMAVEFDFNGSFPFTQMLRDQISGLNDSWAIRWQASAFLRDKLTLYPGKSYVLNIGFDSSGTHSGITDVYDGSLQMEDLNLKRIVVDENAQARANFEAYFRSIRPNLFSRLGRKLYAAISGLPLMTRKSLRD